MTTHTYLPADQITPGDILPDISKSPVSSVAVFPNDAVRVTFEGTLFLKYFPHGGPDFGYPAVRVERD